MPNVRVPSQWLVENAHPLTEDSWEGVAAAHAAHSSSAVGRLKESIRRHGVRVPIEVTHSSDYGYAVNEGHHRVLAAYEHGRDVPVTFSHHPDDKMGPHDCVPPEFRIQKSEQTNPAAVQQIKDARANKMGQLTPKPKIVVRATAGPMAQGSGIRIVKGYVESGENDSSYGGVRHTHSGAPPNIMRHLSESHGWDEGDFNRAADANPTESPQAFELTLRQHHHNEHPRPPVHDQPTPLSERRLAPSCKMCGHSGRHHPEDQSGTKCTQCPRCVSSVPDELPDDIKNMKLDKSNVPADHDACHYDTCGVCGQTVHACTVNRPWNHQFARGQDETHRARPAYENHAEGEWCQGCNDAVMRTDALDELIGNEHTHFGGYEDNVGKDYKHAHRGPDAHTHAGDSVPDQLPPDIRDRKLDKSAADECSWCKEGESSEDAAHKMAAAHKSVSPGEFADKAVHEGVHSGLVSPKGDIYAEKGYAHHGAICNKAKILHPYGVLVRKHGWARLTGSERGSEHVGIEMRHNLGSRVRDTVSDVGMYTESHGGRLGWDCIHPQDYHAGDDYSSLSHHLNRMQNSFAKGRGVWLRTQAKGFEGRPMSLKRTKRGLAFRKSDKSIVPYRPRPRVSVVDVVPSCPKCTHLLHDHALVYDGPMTNLVRCNECQKAGKQCFQHIDDAQSWMHGVRKSVRIVVIVKSMADVRSIKRFTAKHVKPEHWSAADNWLHGAKQTIEERTGGHPITHEGIQIGRAPTREHVAQGLAAMSPRQGWGTGAFAFDKVHGREMVGDKDNRGIGLGNSVRRTRTALRGGGMGSGRTGKKTRALADLIQGGSSLPMDTHADRVIHYGRKPDHALGQVSGKRHDEHAEAFRSAATDLGHEPRRHFVATWLAARDWKGKTSTGIRAARANEDSAGQPNVLQHTGLWPGSTRDPKLLMNSKTIWSKLPEGLRSEVKLGRIPRGDFARVSSNARYLPAQKRIDVGPLTLRTRVVGMPGTIRRTRSEKDWSVAHEMGHHMHSTRHQEAGAGDWNALPDHEKDYLTARLRGAMVTHYNAKDMGPEGLAEGYAHLFSGAFSSARLKTNAPQAHAMLSAKLDNAKKYWKSQAIYGAHASLEKGAGRSLLTAESDTIITMTAKPQEGGV